MIKRFGSVYPGDVDMEDVGYSGVPVNERRLPDEHLATVFDKTTAIAQAMDRVGFDALWLAEHHFQREGHECIPNILMLAVHLAHLTSRLRFGSAFNATTMWHPLRLAEDYAVADVLTGGRVIFGVGRGYHTREVESFGAPLLDQDANRELFEEQVDVIMSAFHQESFSHQGKHYQIPPPVQYRGYELSEITLVPRPINRPVECWQPIVSASPRGIQFMVKHGIKGMIGGGAATGGFTGGVVNAWRDALADAGQETELGAGLAIGFSFFLADTVEEAIEQATPYYEERIKMFAPLGMVRGLSDGQMDALSDPGRASLAGIPTLTEAVETGSWLCGPPDFVIDALRSVEKSLPGLEDVTVNVPIGMPESMVVEQLERFGRHVIPAFQDN